MGTRLHHGGVYAVCPPGITPGTAPTATRPQTVTITGGEVATLDWRHH